MVSYIESMNATFQSILVPVDYSINTEVAIKKAIDLSDENTLIHLMNVPSEMTYGIPFSNYRYQVAPGGMTNIAPNDERMYEWKTAIEEGYGVRVCAWFCYGGSIQSHIEAKARELAVDLIIIGKNSHHYLLPFLNTVIPSSIAEKTGIPVLTVKPGALDGRTKKIIIPINDEAMQNKMELFQLLNRKHGIRVYLVSFVDRSKPVDFHASSLMKAYHWLKIKLHCPVEYTVLHGRNKAREILKYAEEISADVLILNPQTETRTGWLNQRISDMLPSESKLQVLAVKPAY